MTTIINGSSPSITFSDGSAQTSATRPFQNRIINGAMVIDQRNAGASVTLDGSESFPLDRFACGDVTDGVFTAQQVTDAPTGFINSLKCTITTADTNLTTTQNAYVKQVIEGLNCTDLAWGSANAKTVTLSFWVKSSLTGTFGGALRNSGASRSYPFSYTISSANTWEQKSVTIAGDTTGTWLTTNGVGIDVQFSLGAGPDRVGTANAWVAANNVGVTGQVQVIGTLNATWFLAGVQLEVGSTATSFDYRPYGTELALCQRYYYLIAKGTSTSLIGSSAYFSATRADGVLFIPTSMRSVPTFSLTTGASYYRVYLAGSSYTTPSISLNGYTANYSGVYFYNNTDLAGLSNGAGWWESMNASSLIALTAEL